jgi:hypothetical protein
MNHIRLRTKQAAKEDFQGVSYHIGSEGAWVEDAITPLHCWPISTVSGWMRDTKSLGVRKFTDCSHVSLARDLGLPSPHVAGQYIPDYIWGQGDRLYRCPVTHIVESAELRHPHLFASQFPYERVEKWFKENQLPTRINISRDPFESSFSVWFLVVDLIQLPKLIASIFSRDVIRRRDAFGSKTAKQLADDALMVKFGILPTARDLQDFVKALKRFREGIDAFEEMYDHIYRWRSQTLNFKDCVPDSMAVECLLNSFGFGDLHVGRSTTVVSCDFHRTLAYAFACPELRGWLSRARQLVDLLGILDPQALWDVIPFSFVVDWFLPVGNWLHNNRPRLFRGDLVVEDYCESMKLQLRHTWWLKPRSDRIFANAEGEIANGETTSFAGQTLETVYLRRVFTPDVTTGIQTTPNPILRLGQLRTAAQLTAQRIPRPGLIGAEFDAVNFDGIGFPPNSLEAAKEAAVNRAFAAQQRDRLSARGGLIPSLQKFERGWQPSNRPDFVYQAKAKIRQVSFLTLTREPRIGFGEGTAGDSDGWVPQAQIEKVLDRAKAYKRGKTKLPPL